MWLLGADIGTSGCKVAAYGTDGLAVGEGHRGHEIITRAPGWAEEEPWDWWNGFKEATRMALDQAHIDPSQIAAIGVSSANGVVAVGKGGEPLGRAIMQLDRRAIAEAEYADSAGADAIFEITGNRMAVGSSAAPTIMWLQRHDETRYRDTIKFLAPAGFIVAQLTGELVMDPSRASTTALMDIRNRSWSAELCELYELELNKLPDLSDSAKVIGTVTREAGVQTGFKQGTPVVAGCMDTVAAAVGAGLVKEGEALCVLGTVARICFSHKVCCFDSRFLNSCHVTPDMWLSTAPIDGAGASIHWFEQLLGFGQRPSSECCRRGNHEFFDLQAEDSGPGAGGLVYLPFLAGERSPIWNPHARGVLFGLRTTHRKPDVARAVLEGLCFAVRHNIEIIEEKTEVGTTVLPVTGGGAKSRIWLQILADVLGKTVSLPARVETETLGSAIVARLGIETGVSLIDLVSSRDPFAAQIVPRREHKEMYDRAFSRYIRLCTKLEGEFAPLE